MSATGMPLTFAIGTSLVVVATFGAATAASYAASGLIDWKIAALFILGGVMEEQLVLHSAACCRSENARSAFSSQALL
jgi:hypothetical protein